MAGKLIRTSMLTIAALLSNSMNPDCVQASFQTVGKGVLRIDLERKYLNHLVQLEDTVDVDNLMIEGSESPASVETDLLIDADESNYSVLRDMQRKHINKKQ